MHAEFAGPGVLEAEVPVCSGGALVPSTTRSGDGYAPSGECIQGYVAVEAEVHEHREAEGGRGGDGGIACRAWRRC